MSDDIKEIQKFGAMLLNAAGFKKPVRVGIYDIEWMPIEEKDVYSVMYGSESFPIIEYEEAEGYWAIRFNRRTGKPIERCHKGKGIGCFWTDWEEIN